MLLKNRFKEEDWHRVWEDHKFCAECGSNQNCSLHHIKSTESDSILNSIMLCHEHHKIADGHNQSDKKFISKYLKYTIRQALKNDYQFTENDVNFYKQNEGCYN